MAAQYGGEPPPVSLLMMIDPPSLPGMEFNASDLDAADLLRERVSSWFLDARERLEEIPFDIDDSKMLAIATEVGATVELSISTHQPTPYGGSVQVLAIAPIAQMVDRPHWPWRRVLVGPMGLATLQCQHQEIFTTRAPEVFQWLKKHLDELQSPRREPQGA